MPRVYKEMPGVQICSKTHEGREMLQLLIVRGILPVLHPWVVGKRTPLTWGVTREALGCVLSCVAPSGPLALGFGSFRGQGLGFASGSRACSRSASQALGPSPRGGCRPLPSLPCPSQPPEAASSGR